MYTKILRNQLVASFLISIISIGSYLLRDSIGDNFLEISSAVKTQGFLSYYISSLLTAINYYAGPWLFPFFLVFASLYAFKISKRADFVDVFIHLELLLVSFLFSYFTFPNLIGGGLHHFVRSLESDTLLAVCLLVLMPIFMWSVYREDFISKSKEIYTALKNADYSSLFSSKTVIDLKNKFSESLGKDLYKSKMDEFASKFKRNESVEKNDLGINKADTLLKSVKSEKQVIALPPVSKDEICSVGNEQLNGDEEKDLSPIHLGFIEDETEQVRVERPISNINDSSYFEMISLNKANKANARVVHPDDSYFEDIKNRIQDKLAEFKIEGQIINVLKGPVVDTFELELGTGMRVSRVTGAEKDLSLALYGAPIRIVYPIKGRTTVGIEVPRDPREIIYLDELLGSDEFNDTNFSLPVAMGKDAFGESFVVDLAAMPHMLVAGSTGAGKSVFINTLLMSLLVKKSPNQMKLILIDPKQLELALYAKLPHLILPVITDAKTASISLLWACEEMERRYSIMKEFGVRNIDGFNAKLSKATPEMYSNVQKYYDDLDSDSYELPYIVIIVDEFADLILTKSGKEIETNICRLAAKARAAGIHLVLATQRPSVDVITGLIKSNFPTRVSFRVTSSIDSRTILNTTGAEKLLGKGDMLYKHGVETIRVHSSYVNEEEIEILTEKLAEMPARFDSAAMEFLENEGKSEEEMAMTTTGLRDDIGDDEKYDEAVRVVIEHRSASASLLQRRLGVGYNRAANLIEEMESRGVVGPAQGSKPRKVLLSADYAESP